jgi:hypothetical protein
MAPSSHSGKSFRKLPLRGEPKVPVPRAVPLDEFVDGMGEREAQQRAVQRLREGLRATRRGRLLLGKVGQHRREVRRLLTTVRAISAAWHELGGAAFYQHAVRSAQDPAHMIPMSINGVTRERLIDVLLPLFARHGSPELRRDIERYRSWGVDMALSVTTIDEVPETLARGRSRV